MRAVRDTRQPARIGRRHSCKGGPGRGPSPDPRRKPMNAFAHSEHDAGKLEADHGAGTMPELSTSRKFMPAARTSTRTSPGPGATSPAANSTNLKWLMLPGLVEPDARPRDPPAALSHPDLPGPTVPPVAHRTARQVGSSSAQSSAGIRSSESDAASRSTKRSMRSGCSLRALRTRPHSGACARSVTRSSGPVPIAERVTNTTGAVARRGSESSSCRSASPPAVEPRPPGNSS